MFYALGNKRPKKAAELGEVEEEEEPEEEGFIDQKLKKGKFKNTISQSQMEEKKR
jgi:hypothetical protein